MNTQATNLRIIRSSSTNTLCDVVEVDRRGNVLCIVHAGLTLEQAQAIVGFGQDEQDCTVCANHQ